MKIGDYITTYTDIQFNPFDPEKEKIEIEDIAHALSYLCRANGHFKSFYSVGQHSLNCAKEAKMRNYSKRVQLACLLHDGSEAYLSDVTRPVKKRMPAYLEIEKKLQNAIYEKYNLYPLQAEEIEQVKKIDDLMLAYELKELLNVELPVKDALMEQHNLEFVQMNEVKEDFIQVANALYKAI